MQTLQILLDLLTGFVREHARRARASATVGASSTEYILVVLGGIVIAGIVVAAITMYVRNKTAELGG